MTMSKARGRFVRFAVSAAILSAGVLPSSCQVQFRDAVVAGALSFTSATVSTALGTLLPVNALLGTQ